MSSKKNKPRTEPKLRSLKWVLLLIFFIAAFYCAKTFAPTFDEPGHIAASYLLTETPAASFFYDASHPPFLRKILAFPLRWMAVEFPDYQAPPLPEPGREIVQVPAPTFFSFSRVFLFQNMRLEKPLLLAARCMNILLGLFLGGLIFFWVRQFAGETAGLIALLLYVLSPNLIAHSALVTTDFGGVVWMVTALYAILAALPKDESAPDFFAGAAIALALGAKYSNLILIPAWVAAILIGAILNKNWHWAARKILRSALAFYVVLLFIFSFSEVWGPHVFDPQDLAKIGWAKTLEPLIRWVPLPKAFLAGVLSIFYHNDNGHAGFLLGNYSTQGWWYYFPVALFVKTPTALWVLSLWVLIKKMGIIGQTLKNWRTHLAQFSIPFYLTLFLITAFFLAMTSSIQIGIRHVLWVYPILYLLLAKPLAEFWQSPQMRRGLIACFVLLGLEVGVQAMHPLAFFNWISGGPQRGERVLSDSNIDWGQDLKSLAELVHENGNPQLVLSFFGSALPETYGLRYQSLLSYFSLPNQTQINSLNPEREWLAISVTMKQGTYFKARDLFHWTRTRQPLAILGHSLYVYDITQDASAHEHLAQIYELTGELQKAVRERQQANLIEKREGGQGGS